MTLENAWKAAARHWHAEVVRLRALNNGLSQANREAHTGIATRRERETCLQDALIKRNMRIEDLERRLDGVLRDAFTTVHEPNELSAHLEALLLRAIDADRKHPRDIADGMPLEEDASVYLERARALLNRRSTWLRARDELADRESVIGFEALAARIAEADRKHPRDLKDTHLSATDAENCLYEVRRELKQHSTWAAALECEMWEAISAAISESDERLADELLDVAALSLRWRRAILERGK